MVKSVKKRVHLFVIISLLSLTLRSNLTKINRSKYEEIFNKYLTPNSRSGC